MNILASIICGIPIILTIILVVTMQHAPEGEEGKNGFQRKYCLRAEWRKRNENHCER